MPEPVIVHVIGTVTLLSVSMLLVASFAIAQYINYVQMLNAMLSEAAEACARQIVELVSIHTLGGGEYTYMLLTLPQSLGGQPYNITLANLGENMMMVIAQLQLHRQVRIVVTPNFGQAPVYAVTTTMRFGDLVVSPTILLPVPRGWKAALVAVRNGSTILIGFTYQPPTRVSGGRPPSCRFLDWTRSVTGQAGSTVLVNFTIFNPGDVSSLATVEVVDDRGTVMGNKTVLVKDGWIATGSIPVRLILPGGVYTWRLICTCDSCELATVGVVVEVSAPIIERDVTTPIVGEAGSTGYLNVTLKNVGRVAGTANLILELDERILAEEEVVILPGETRQLSLAVQLPSTPGSYSARLKIHVVETGETSSIPITLIAVGNDPYIAFVNSTLVGLPGWKPKLYVRIENPSDTPATVDIEVNGQIMARENVPARGSIEVVVRPSMPTTRGIYTWQVALRKEGRVVSSATVLVEVRDYKGVRGNRLFVGSGPYELKDEDRVCGREHGTNRRRCVTNSTLFDSLRDLLYQGVWVAVKVDLSDSGDVYRGVGLSTVDGLYEVSANRWGPHVQLSVMQLSGGLWSEPDLSETGRLPRDGYYPLHVYVACDGKYCNFNAYLYGTSPPLYVRSSRQGRIPHALALLVDKFTGRFTDVVVTRGDSRFVLVEGLPPGWTVELWDDDRLIATSSDGRLFVAANYVLRNARLTLIDPYNERLPCSWRIEQLLVGGDVIVFSREP